MFTLNNLHMNSEWEKYMYGLHQNKHREQMNFKAEDKTYIDIIQRKIKAMKKKGRKYVYL